MKQPRLIKRADYTPPPPRRKPVTVIKGWIDACQPQVDARSAFAALFQQKETN